MKVVVNKRYTSDQVRRLTAPLALDLTAMFKQLQQEMTEELGKAQRAGETPQVALKRLDNMFGEEDIDADET